MKHKDEAPLSEVGLVLCSIVKERPGIHFRGLARAASLTSAGQLRHHIDRLKRHGRLVEVQDGRYKRFFMAGHHDPNLRPGLARFSRPVPRQIGKLLLNRPMNRTELRRSLGCADSTLGYHLKRMVQLGDLQKERGRNCCKYILRDGELVRKVLMMHDAMPAELTPRFREARGPRRWSPQGVAHGAPPAGHDAALEELQEQDDRLEPVTVAPLATETVLAPRAHAPASPPAAQQAQAMVDGAPSALVPPAATTAPRTDSVAASTGAQPTADP